MTFALLLLLALQDLEKDLEETVRRLDSSEIDERDKAQTDLERIAFALGPEKRGLLKHHARTAGAEAGARLEEQIALLGRVAECRKFVAVFDAIPMPSIERRKFVHFNPGKARLYDPTRLPYPDTNHGWILHETEKELSLLEDSVECIRCSRPRLNPKDADRYRRDYPWLKPLPGEYEILDFRCFCDKILDEGRFCAWPALYAFWSLKLGLPRQAVRLMDLEERRTAPRNPNAPRNDPILALATGVEARLGGQAAQRAAEGASFEELIDRWPIVADLPHAARPEKSRSLR